MEVDLLRAPKGSRRQAGSRKRRVAANPTHVGGAWRSRSRLPRTTRSAAVRSTWRTSASAGSPTRTLQAQWTREARSVSRRSRKARVIFSFERADPRLRRPLRCTKALREDVDDVDELDHDVGACRDGGQRLQRIIAFGREVEADDDPANIASMLVHSQAARLRGRAAATCLGRTASRRAAGVPLLARLSSAVADAAGS